MGVSYGATRENARYRQAMLTVIAAATPDPAPWWATYLTPAAALLGVVVGALLGPLVEPWKLGAARRARIRQERLDQCARLIEAANHMHVGWLLAAKIALEARRGEIDPKLEQIPAQLVEVERQRGEGLGAKNLLKLYGPSDLADKAQAIFVADAEAQRVIREAVGSEREQTIALENAVAYIKLAIDAFVNAAQEIVR